MIYGCLAMNITSDKFIYDSLKIQDLKNYKSSEEFFRARLSATWNSLKNQFLNPKNESYLIMNIII